MFYFAEHQPYCGLREAEPLKAKTLIAAKREATRRKMFLGTELSIGTRVDSYGYIKNDSLLSIKRNGKWEDCNF